MRVIALAVLVVSSTLALAAPAPLPKRETKEAAPPVQVGLKRTTTGDAVVAPAMCQPIPAVGGGAVVFRLLPLPPAAPLPAPK